MIISIKQHLKYLIKREADKNFWKSEDEFYLIKNLSIDQRGRVGEHFLRDLFLELNKEVEYVNNSHGDYDLIVDNLKIEIKTATLDVNNKFQHEGIKSSKIWDAVCFVDIAPNNIYITFIYKDDFSFDLNKGTFILNGEIRNSHYRGKDNTNSRATGAGYKVDFPLNKLKETKTLKDFEILFENLKKRS